MKKAVPTNWNPDGNLAETPVRGILTGPTSKWFPEGLLRRKPA